LQEQLCQQLMSDWTVPWIPVARDAWKSFPDEIDMVVLDKGTPPLEIKEDTPLIFAGAAEDPGKYFAVQEDKDPEAIFRAIKRAHSYQEITKQNREALYPEHKAQDALESIAQTLSAKVHQLIRQSEMRIALVDQMPIGVLGIDDENMLVLANNKAIELLSMEDIPIWGLPIVSLLGNDIEAFLSAPKESFLFTRYGRELEFRKTPFLLDSKLAGTILVLWERNGSKNE